MGTRFGDRMPLPPLRSYDQNIFLLLESNFSYDPYPYLTEIDVPMLYVYGGKDENVPTEASVDVLDKLIR